MGGYYFGYYIAIFNPLGEPLAEKVYNYTGDQKLNLIGNLNLFFTIGAAISVFLSGPLSNLIGRIRLILFLEFLALGTCLLYSFKSVTILLALRAASGIITGLNAAVVPVALTEMFPGSLSGFTGVFFYFSLTCFILLSFFVNPLCGSEEDKDARAQCLADNWRPLLVFPGAVSLIRLLMLIFLYKFGALESPGYYINKFSDSKEKLTQELKKWFSTVYAEDYVDRRVEQAIRLADKSKNQEKPSYGAMFSGQFRFRFFVVCMLNVLQQLSGINFLIFFSTALFDQLSGNGATMSILIGAANIFGAVVGMYSIGRYGRRFNLIMGCLLQALSFATLGMGKLDRKSVV